MNGSLLFAGLVEVVSKRELLPTIPRYITRLTCHQVYANSMLAMLNARNIMRNKSDAVDTVELSGQRITHHATINPMVCEPPSIISTTLTSSLQSTRVEIFKETSMITDSNVRPEMVLTDQH